MKTESKDGTLTEKQLNIMRQAEALRARIAKQEEREISQNDWAARLGVSATTYSRLLRDKYNGNATQWTIDIAKKCAALNKLAVADKLWKPENFFELGDYEFMFGAVAKAIENGKEGRLQRIAWYLARQGGGKTQYGLRLKMHYGGYWVVARQSWASSYFSALQSIALAIGITEGLTSAGEAESAIIAQLNLEKDPPVIYFDETEFLSPMLQNLLKMLINETQAVLVILCQPEFYNKIRRSKSIHSKQLMRRNVAVITMTALNAANAGKWLAGIDCENLEIRKACGKALADAANLVGDYDCCETVARYFVTEGLPLTLDDLKVAIDTYQRIVGHVAPEIIGHVAPEKK